MIVSIELFRLSLRAASDRELTLDDFIGQCRTPCGWCANMGRQSDRGLLDEDACGTRYEFEGQKIECSWRPEMGQGWARIDKTHPLRIILNQIEIGQFGEHDDPWGRLEEEVDQSWDTPTAWLSFQPEKLFDDLHDRGLVIELLIEVSGESTIGSPAHPVRCPPEFLAACKGRGLKIRFRQVETTCDFLD